MCSICGMVDFINPEYVNMQLVQKMGAVLNHRGPDQNGSYVEKGIAFQHNRLAIVDIERGLQPMKRTYEGKEYVIIYNGEIYNSEEIRHLIEKEGIVLQTTCDTELVLYLYILYKQECSKLLNGIFAFAVWDKEQKYVYLARDRFGIKPLFYTRLGSTLIFASEIKSLLVHPLVKRVLNHIGIWQLMFMSPTKIQGKSLLEDIDEVPCGYDGIYQGEDLHLRPYWRLEAKPFSDTENEAIMTTRDLLKDAIEKQLVSDVPLATLLSGGLDSSIITSVAAKKYQEEGRRLTTYSFEYEENRKYFNKTLFQPQSDDDFASKLANILGTDHNILTVSIDELADLLRNAAIYRDGPGMADIDSSLLYYFRMIKRNHTVVLSGECADEIFGGYPWFYREEMLNNGFFPWIHDSHERAGLFRSEKVKEKEGFEYINNVYKKSIAACPTLENDSATMKQSRIATWLSVNYFMTSLLERKDRMSMASGVEVRVPFADHRIIEYVYNVPWEIKFKNSVEKSLLRSAMKDYLPDLFLNRKKSPYPKTHHPKYEEKVIKYLNEILLKKDCRLYELIDRSTLNQILKGDNVTWFGQLMSRPQLIAWLIQLEAWMEYYDIAIKL